MHFCLTEFFQTIEQFICIKMDLALNNQQRLICYQTQTNKHAIHTYISKHAKYKYIDTIYIYIYIYINIHTHYIHI